ncbi:hypothetical protein QE370_003461 [Aeromicrobium sp. SORGH_AS981]|uniref:hypothetical protein n=1 Tax=Aeromicrobium sp. SORGH_AS_0981 TaxID=3041802 RepID=UPI0028597218|nr:hypothetical protein [Aeromicrobium sp. SORGH_AS_0981]MDR6120277.1 hypothetical protein [Aeromicrobium sp. SORGH_AS_0981]
MNVVLLVVLLSACASEPVSQREFDRLSAEAQAVDVALSKRLAAALPGSRPISRAAHSVACKGSDAEESFLVERSFTVAEASVEGVVDSAEEVLRVEGFEVREPSPRELLGQRKDIDVSVSVSRSGASDVAVATSSWTACVKVARQ